VFVTDGVSWQRIRAFAAVVTGPRAPQIPSGVLYGLCTVKFASLWSVIDRFSCNKIFTLP
jgi:hypothetical protein